VTSEALAAVYVAVSLLTRAASHTYT